MNSNFLGPLGPVVGMGVQRLINENNALNAKRKKLKLVDKSKEAFINPLPLKGPGKGKAIDKLKPNVPNVGRPISLKPNQRVPNAIDQIQEQFNRRRIRRRKKQKEDDETTTGQETSSSTTPESTTTPEPSSTTPAQTTNPVQSRQMKLRDGLNAAKKLANAIRPPMVPALYNSTNSTSSYSTTTSTTGTTPELSTPIMAKRDKQNNKSFSSPLDVTTAMGKSAYTDFNKPGSSESVFSTPAQSSPVSYGMMIPGTLHLNINEGSDLTAPDFNGRYFINISSFSDAINNIQISNKENYNDEMSNHFYDVFYRMNKDVISNARSSVSSSWNAAIFIDTMGYIAEALEVISCFDSITAYDPKMADIYNRSDAADEYQKLFNTTDLLTARYNLARRLKSIWFPPEFAQMIRWFYQLYRVSPLSQAAYYRYVPHGAFILNNPSGSATTVGSTAYLKAYMEGLIANLVSANTQNICSIFARLYPQGIIRNIPYACSDAVYDDTHFEIYSNEPVVWRNPIVTAEATPWQVYPIIYGSGTGSSSNPGSVNNEIPYYMSHNPNDKDGFAFVLQTTYCTAGTTGNGIVENSATDKNTTIEGIRSFTPWNIAAGPIVNVTQTIINSNKWVFDHTGLKFYARCGNIPNAITGNDANSVIAYTTTNATTWSITPISRPNTAHQRVYFNNRKAPQLNRRILVDKLFSIAG